MAHNKLISLRFYILALLAFLAVLAWLSLRGLPDGRLHVYFLDVGQGDAILIHTPDGRQILVDGGPSPAALLDELGALMPFWDRSLDLVVLTHPDADHMTGLLPLFERYRVDTVMDNAAGDVTTPVWTSALSAYGGERVDAQRGLRVALDDVRITVLHPAGFTDRDAGDNNASLMLRLDYGATSFLLTGDAEQAAEQSLLAAGLPLQADVLKVAHHGSAGSTSTAFVSAVQPRLAVIQVGADNRFGHPHPDVLARLTPAQVLRTDLNGRVEVISDGQQLWVQTEH